MLGKADSFNQTPAPETPFKPLVSVNITSFNHQQGLYYESYGQARVSHNKWDLVVYVDLTTHYSKYDTLMSHYKRTVQICDLMTEHFGSTEISDTCEEFKRQFTQSTLPYLYEIESNHRNVMLSIEQNPDEENRFKRGLGHTFKRFIHVLHEMSSKIDYKSVFNKVIELAINKAQNINLIKERTRVVRAETSEKHFSQQITEHQQKLEENLRYLQNQTSETIQNINKLTFRTKLLEQSLLFELTLNKYAYETQNLISMINAALNGKIHATVINKKTLIEELREIKIVLPSGNALPIELDTESLTEIFKISEITIFHQDNYLIYSIQIPLISSSKYTVYHPIPLPIQFDTNSVVLINTEVDVIALSDDNEDYLTFNTEQWEKCKELKAYNLCEFDQPIQHQIHTYQCLVSSFTNQQTLPETCELRFVSLDTIILHRLPQTNSWLYYTKPLKGTMVCSDPPQKIKIEISGVGRISIHPTCELHISNFILTPTNSIDRDVNLDIIPENPNNKILITLTEILKFTIPQKIFNKDLIKNLNTLAKTSDKISELIQIPPEPIFIFKIGFHLFTIYVFFFIFIFVASVLVIKYKNNIVRMYTPELPNLTQE